MSELHGCLNAVRSNESIVELIKNIHGQSSFPVTVHIFPCGLVRLETVVVA